MSTSKAPAVRTNSSIKRYKSPLIKWYNTNMTYMERYKLGLLSYQEYIYWQQQLALGIDLDDPQSQALLQAPAAPADTASAYSTTSNTFWKNDEAERTNLSTDAYSDFLSNNNIDVSNKSAVNFDELYNQVNNESNQAEPVGVQLTQDEILANVNRDIHGGDENRILSEEEIAALFAAANG